MGCVMLCYAILYYLLLRFSSLSTLHAKQTGKIDLPGWDREQVASWRLPVVVSVCLISVASNSILQTIADSPRFAGGSTFGLLNKTNALHRG